jgi:hypothetical protein
MYILAFLLLSARVNEDDETKDDVDDDVDGEDEVDSKMAVETLLNVIPRREHVAYSHDGIHRQRSELYL